MAHQNDTQDLAPSPGIDLTFNDCFLGHVPPPTKTNVHRVRYVPWTHRYVGIGTLKSLCICNNARTLAGITRETVT